MAKDTIAPDYSMSYVPIDSKNIEGIFGGAHIPAIHRDELSSPKISGSMNNQNTAIVADPGVGKRENELSNLPDFVEKPQSSLRWIMLLIFCLTMITNYYCYDIPAALKSQVIFCLY
jgi:hypothetical protein